MAFAGLKKQINKANQYITEKIGGAEGTKLGDDFVEMEKRTDITYELVDELQLKTKEYLQPNPTARAKMAAVKGISKLSGQAKASTYPQPEGVLGECMTTYGRRLGEDSGSVFALSLIEAGESLKQMADNKYSLDDNVKQNFLEPLHHLQTKDLKEVMYMTEKIGGAEGTKLDDDFVEMEKRTDITYELVDELQLKTKEYLQPNPTARAKMAAVKGISKLSGQAKASTYPQPEGVLGECMTTYGRRLGEDSGSVFALSLIEAGESLKQMADNKYSLDDNVKQNFLEPLHHLQTKDLKEVMHHRKKLQGRRLDFDCKKRKQAKGTGSHISDDEIKLAEDKFAESLHLAQMGMYNLLENDIEQVSQLATFAECLLDYHKQCTEILGALVETLSEKKEEAARRPKREFKPKTVHDLQLHLDVSDGHSDHSRDTLNGGPPPPYFPSAPLIPPFHQGTTPRSPLPSPAANPKAQHDWDPMFPAGNSTPTKSSNASPMPSPMKSSPARTPAVQGPCCQALYDFDPENPGELGFKEGDTIVLINRIDENWYEGNVNGKTGYFPVSYVQVLVPLPQ